MYCSANKFCSHKSDTSAVSDVKVVEELDDKRKRLKARNEQCFESGGKAKIRVIKTEFKMIQISKEEWSKKGDVVITGPYTTVSKELNLDMVFVNQKTIKKKASSFILELYFAIK
jgi:HlyD family secretion protein